MMSIHPLKLMRPIVAGMVKSGLFRAAQHSGHVSLAEERVVDRSELEMKLQTVTNELANELIALTPEFMKKIQFEIVSTEDGGADIGLMEIHPEVKYVALSPLVYDCCSKYLPLVKQFAPGWRRSLITLQEGEGDWKLTVDFEYK
jgi:hypothetical protein